MATATCFGCKKFGFTGCSLIEHIRMFCKFTLTFNFQCGEVGCFRLYSGSYSFKKHLLRCHGVPYSLVSSSSSKYSPVKLEIRNDSDLTHCNVSLLNRKLTLFFASLYSNPCVPRNQIQTVSTGVVDCFQFFLSLLKQNVTQTSENDFEDFFSLDENLLEYNSEYKRFKTFESYGTYIPPDQHTVGFRTEICGQSKRIMNRPNTIQIVPLGKVFRLFFSLPNLLKETIDNMNTFRDVIPLSNIIQGSVWRKMTSTMSSENKNNEIHIPIVLFFDDFEVNNPLGSHCTIHKLGALYVSIPVLPKKYMSLLNSIFLFQLFHASDRKTFGNKVIFDRAIRYLNTLSSEGIFIATDFYTGLLKFHVVCITGDNLGLNGILGFVESFIANYCCRICSVSKDRMQSLYYEDVDLIRNSDTYERDSVENDVSKTGIKEKCCWLKLKGFDLFNNVAVDLMHDYLEGCCSYIMHFVIKHFLDIKVIKLNLLISRIKNFDYGPDGSASPVNAVLLEGSKIKIKTSASEMKNLVRYFTLIIGEFIMEDDEVWLLYLTLRQILDNLLRHRYYECNIRELASLIEELLDSYSKITKDSIKPKFHFMTHYPSFIKKFGPLTQVWTMRHESKHRVSKIAARSVATRINICKTVAVRNQLTLNYILMKNEAFDTFTCSKLEKLSKAKKMVFEQNFCEYDTNSVFSLKWFKLDGIRVQDGDVLILSLCPESFYPIFIKIVDIWVDLDSKDLFFCALKFDCLSFDSHFLAYEVTLSENRKIISANELYSLVPQTATYSSKESCFITLRIAID